MSDMPTGVRLDTDSEQLILVATLLLVYDSRELFSIILKQFNITFER